MDLKSLPEHERGDWDPSDTPLAQVSEVERDQAELQSMRSQDQLTAAREKLSALHGQAEGLETKLKSEQASSQINEGGSEAQVALLQSHVHRLEDELRVQQGTAAQDASAADEGTVQVANLEAAVANATKERDQMRLALQQTRREWASGMARAQLRFKAHFDLSDAMIRLRSIRLSESLTAWKAILPPGKERTPLGSQVRQEKELRKEAETEAGELRRSSLEATVLAKRLKEENRRLKLALEQAGVGKKAQDTHSQLVTAHEQLESASYSYEGRILDLQQALAREKELVIRAEEERDTIKTRCEQDFQQMLQTAVQSGAELQGLLIQDKMAALGKEHERGSEIIEMSRQHNDRILNLQNAARKAEDALEAAKEGQYRELQELDKTQQTALVNHHSQAFVQTLKQLEAAVDLATKRAERAESAIEQLMATSPPSELHKWKARAIQAEAEQGKQEGRLCSMMAQLEEVQQQTAWQERELEEKVERSEKTAKEIKVASQSELRSQQEAHMASLAELEKRHKSSQERAASLERELAVLKATKQEGIHTNNANDSLN